MSSHRRRRGFRGRPLLTLLAAAFLLVGVCAATGIAWDPFARASGQDGAAASAIGTPWSAGTGTGSGSPTPAATGQAPPAPGGSPGGAD
ncbi:hypothetical protein VR46_31870, partial [Streptomyces sp. NRRL S-444]